MLIYPLIMLISRDWVRKYQVRAIDRRSQLLSAAVSGMFIRMIFFRQRFVGGADCFWRRIAGYLEIVVVCVHPVQSGFLHARYL